IMMERARSKYGRFISLAVGSVDRTAGSRGFRNRPAQPSAHAGIALAGKNRCYVSFLFRMDISHDRRISVDRWGCRADGRIGVCSFSLLHGDDQYFGILDRLATGIRRGTRAHRGITNRTLCLMLMTRWGYVAPPPQRRPSCANAS